MNPYSVLNDPRKYKELFLTTFERILKPNSDEEKALLMKVKMTITYKDFNSAIRMLLSFKKGVKRIKGRYKWGTIGRHGKKESHWVKSAHGEYVSLGENDGKGHFRWNHGELYTLSPESLSKVEKFIKLLKLDEL